MQASTPCGAEVGTHKDRAERTEQQYCSDHKTIEATKKTPISECSQEDVSMQLPHPSYPPSFKSRCLSEQCGIMLLQLTLAGT